MYVSPRLVYSLYGLKVCNTTIASVGNDFIGNRDVLYILQYTELNS